MRNRPIFIGPTNYPPDDVMAEFQSLTVNIHDSAGKVEVDPFGGAENLSYITNVSTTSSGLITFDIVCANPVTGDKFLLNSTDPRVKFVRSKGSSNHQFHLGESRYNISPCCVVITWCEQPESVKDLTLSCKYPLTASVEDNKLKIDVEESVDIIASPPIEPSTGISAINGITTTNGGINIKGVGAVSITVAGA